MKKLIHDVGSRTHVVVLYYQEWRIFSPPSPLSSVYDYKAQNRLYLACWNYTGDHSE